MSITPKDPNIQRKSEDNDLESLKLNRAKRRELLKKRFSYIGAGLVFAAFALCIFSAFVSFVSMSGFLYALLLAAALVNLSLLGTEEKLAIFIDKQIDKEYADEISYFPNMSKHAKIANFISAGLVLSNVAFSAVLIAFTSFLPFVGAVCFCGTIAASVFINKQLDKEYADEVSYFSDVPKQPQISNFVSAGLALSAVAFTSLLMVTSLIPAFCIAIAASLLLGIMHHLKVPEKIADNIWQREQCEYDDERQIADGSWQKGQIQRANEKQTKFKPINA